MTRNRTIYVEAKTHWFLARLAEAHNKNVGSVSGYELTVNSDYLADTIIQGWVKEHHPKLDELWERRRAIDSEALSL